MESGPFGKVKNEVLTPLPAQTEKSITPTPKKDQPRGTSVTQ
jgi:hypothetical protein